MFEATGLIALDFCLWGWKKSKINKIKVDTRDYLFARILNPADRIKKRKDQLGRTKRDLRTRVTKCTGVDGGITFVMNCNKFIVLC